MPWQHYFAILRRRWWLIAAILLLDVVASGTLYYRSVRHLGYQGCLTLLVEDVSAPSMITAPGDILQSTGLLLEGETAANFFGDDILDVAQSSDVAAWVSNHIPRNLPDSSPAAINGAVSGARRDRTVNLCVANPNARTALVAAHALGTAMTSARARFFGKRMAQRTYVRVVSSAGVTPVSPGHEKLNLALRLLLGLLVAAGAALAWEGLDPDVRDAADVERALGAPVLATVR